MIMIRILLPVFAVLLVLACLLLNNRGLKPFGDPVVVIVVLFLVAVCCIPLLRRAILTTKERNKPSKMQKWLRKVPWLGLFLIWNGLGGILVVCFILSTIQSVQHSIRFPDSPVWGMAVAFFYLLWFLTMPFTTLGVTLFLWRSRRTSMSKVLLLYSLVIFVLWSYPIVAVVAFIEAQYELSIERVAEAACTNSRAVFRCFGLAGLCNAGEVIPTRRQRPMHMPVRAGNGLDPGPGHPPRLDLRRTDSVVG